MTVDPSAIALRPRAEVVPQALEVTYVGTATCLLRWGSVTLLTDPNFLHRGEAAPLGLGLRTRRLKDPAIELDALPALDAVLLSHHHGDHFDPVVIERLDKDLPILTEPRAARKLVRQGFRRPVALDTWSAQVLRSGETTVRVIAVPGRHAPLPLAPLIPPVMGSVLELGYRDSVLLRCYVTGDTLFHSVLAPIPQHFPDLDCCLIHLGGTRIAGVLLTMDDVQGVAALRLVAPRHAVPIHFDDYPVFRSPLADFTRAAERAALPTEIHVLERGETWSLPASGAA